MAIVSFVHSDALGGNATEMRPILGKLLSILDSERVTWGAIKESCPFGFCAPQKVYQVVFEKECGASCVADSVTRCAQEVLAFV